MLMTRMTPKISASPRATSAYSAPESTPERSTCPIIAGVSTTFIRRPGRPLSAPESRLAVREVVRPHVDALTLLPLEQDHLVGGLEAVLVDLVVAEHRPRLQRQQRVAHLVGVEGARPLHTLAVELAARVARRRVIARLVLELLDVGVEELLGAGIGQRALPLGGAVDAL